MDGDAAGLRPHAFTVHDYYGIAAAGVLKHDSRVELISGQILDMSPIGTPHFGMVNRLTRLLSDLISRHNGLISVQNPVRLDDWSEPQPDIAVLQPRDDFYETRVITPSDVLLLIEVADTSLLFDRRTKAPLYAQAGIREYWIVNLVDRVMELHRQPSHGSYQDSRRIDGTGTLDIEALPGIAIRGSEIFPASPA